MQTATLRGGFRDPAIEAARAFREALQAMARPGRIATFGAIEAPAPASPAAATLLLTLADHTTPIHLAGGHDVPALRDWLRFHTGAPLAARAEATFALGTWPALLPLEEYPLGTSEYPDRSATLIVELPALDPAGARLIGPGIATEARLSLPDIAPFQANAGRFPLGLDFFLTAGPRAAAIPRTTIVEAA